MKDKIIFVIYIILIASGTLLALHTDEQKTQRQQQEVVYKEDNKTDTKHTVAVIVLFSSLFLGVYSSFRHIDDYKN